MSGCSSRLCFLGRKAPVRWGIGRFTWSDQIDRQMFFKGIERVKTMPMGVMTRGYHGHGSTDLRD